MPPDPLFSLVLCSLNRASLLDDSLGTIARLDYPVDRHEVIVVDNGSTDDTARVIGAHTARCAHFRSLLEPRPGHTRARNTGIAASRGRILVFIDDDVHVPADFLRALEAAYAERPDAAGFGGRIVLEWDAGRPPWLGKVEEAYWVALDLGPHIVPFAFPAAPFGANMSFRREWLDRVGGFCEDLGYSAAHGRLSARDDMELGYRVMKAGGHLYYAPAAWLTHRITADRSTEQYFLKKAYGQGYADYQAFGVLSSWSTPRKAMRVGLHAAAWVRASLFRALAAPMGKQSRAYMLYRCKQRYNAGYLRAIADDLQRGGG